MSMKLFKSLKCINSKAVFQIIWSNVRESHVNPVNLSMLKIYFASAKPHSSKLNNYLCWEPKKMKSKYLQIDIR